MTLLTSQQKVDIIYITTAQELMIMYNDILKQLRTEKGVSQQVIANYLNITKQAYSLYELGKREPDFETLLKLGEYFDVSTDYILRGKENEPNEDNIKFALWGTSEVDDDVLADVKHYAKIARQMREEKKDNK